LLELDKYLVVYNFKKIIMKKIKEEDLVLVTGGSRQTAIIGGISCIASLIWPIGTLIAGPTCMGMIIKTIID